MATRRWLDPRRDDVRRVTIYHALNRIVDRRYVLGDEEREKFRMFLRMGENFSGCRVLSYCLMSNHFHILLEVPPRVVAVGGIRVDDVDRQGMSSESGESGKGVPEMQGVAISEREFFARLEGLYSEAVVNEIRARVADARERGNAAELAEIFQSYAYRMHDLSEFMRNVTQRFTRWFNRTHNRTGRLWEERFRSVLVEDGIAARTVAAYIDLNPVRAGMVTDPADYRWSSYGEAVAGGKRARAGLVRLLGGKRESTASLPRGDYRDETGGFATWDEKSFAQEWETSGVAKVYRVLLLGQGQEKIVEARVVRKGMKKEVAEKELLELEGRKGDLAIAQVIRSRVRYFTEGVVIGGKDFVNEFFAGNRERFGAKRKDGARKLRGSLATMKGELWSLRDLQG